MAASKIAKDGCQFKRRAAILSFMQLSQIHRAVVWSVLDGLRWWQFNLSMERSGLKVVTASKERAVNYALFGLGEHWLPAVHLKR